MRLALLTLSILCGGCAFALSDDSAKKPPMGGGNYSLSDHPSQDGRCEGDVGIGDLDRSEEACLRQVPQIVERRGSFLQLKFGNGYTRIYSDEVAVCESDQPDNCVRYKLAGFFPRHGLLLIEMSYWEGVEWLLVQTQNGEATKILAPPHYSPHEKWLVSVSASEGPSGGGNGIDIVPTEPGQIAGGWHYRVPDDGDALYEFIGWEGDERVKLTRTSLKEPTTPHPAQVDRVNGIWRLK
jgi:hypothetical protein